MDPFLGQVILFAGNFAPRGWAFCEGQLLAISSNTALFSILGTTYGGDGRTTFQLPDLRGAVAMGAGQRPGSSLNAILGQKAGNAQAYLTVQNLPAHTHQLMASSNEADTKSPSGAYFPNVPRNQTELKYASNIGTALPMGSSIGATGNNIPISTVPPFTGLNYIICLVGTYPSRS